MTPRIGSLFAGYDGIGMAVDRIFPDAERAWFSEHDPKDKRDRYATSYASESR